MPKLKPNQFYLGNHLITEQPILFQTEMVQANMEDRKSQTRRELKGIENYRLEEFINGYWPFQYNKKGNLIRVNSPYGKPGDLLWVREKMIYNKNSKTYWPVADGYYKSADCSYQRVTPSIHMPKSAARLWLMVEDIRVERLQDINKQDAIAEGIKPVNLHDVNTWKRYDGYGIVTSHPVVSFWSLWASINGEASWQANPWVWVVQYRILSKTGCPSDETILQNYQEITGKEATSGT